MVCICTCLCCNIPCFFPCQSFFIDQKVHQFRYCNSRMGIIHLDHDFFMQFTNIVMIFFIPFDQRLQARRNKEILLFQTKLFSCVMIVIRIQNFYDCLCKIFLFHCLVIIATVKRIKLKICDCFCIPNTQCIHNMISISDDRHIVRNCKY